MMTTVYCTYYECRYYKPDDEDYGICQKDHITLAEDGEVSCGCLDAEAENDYVEAKEE